MRVYERKTIRFRPRVLSAAVLLLAGPVAGLRLAPLATAQVVRPAQNRSRQQDGRLDERCANFVKWSRQLEEAYPGRDLFRTAITPAMVVPLFGDAAFVPYFGKPYDRLSSEERQDILRNAIGACLNSEHRRDFTWQMSVLRTPFLPFAPPSYPLGAARLMPAVEALRHARADLARIRAEIASMPATAGNYSRLVTDKAVAAKSLPLLWPGEQNDFNGAMNAAVARIPPPAPRGETLAQEQLTAPPAADCSRMYQVAQQVLGTSRIIVTPIPSEGSTCKVQDRDSGISNSPVGTLAITTYGNNGPSLASYQRSTGRCETMMGLGQVADWCVLSNDYDHRQLSLVVYRNEKRLLDLNFSNWPDTPSISLGQARSLAFQILGPDAPGSASRPPSPAPNSSNSDKLDQFKITPSKKAGQ